MCLMVRSKRLLIERRRFNYPSFLDVDCTFVHASFCVFFKTKITKWTKECIIGRLKVTCKSSNVSPSKKIVSIMRTNLRFSSIVIRKNNLL